MPYITSIERFALARGESRGELRKARESVLEVLEVRFEVVLETIVEAVNQIEDTALLKSLHRQAITIATLEEFQALLPQPVESDSQDR